MLRARRLERLTASDLFLLLWDDYGWSTDIGGLAILDGDGLLNAHGQLDIDHVRRHLESRLHRVPRFRQLLYRPPRGLGWPLWVDAPDFNLADHVRVQRLQPPGEEPQLLETCEELGRRPFDHSRPLWELWLLSGLPDRRFGAFLKLHHVLADGPAAMAAFAALLDDTADAPFPPALPWNPAPLPTVGELFADNLRRRGQELGRGLSGLVHPGRTVQACRRVLPAWREVLTDKPAPRTSLNRSVGTQRRLALVRSQLEPARQIAHLYGAKVNDVVLTAVTGGLRQLLMRREELSDGLVQRAMVTVSQHQPALTQAQGNKPGWMMVPLPIGEADTERRLELIARETATRKDRARPEAGTGIFRFVAFQRIWYRLFPRQRSVNLVVSNVPGPPIPLYLAGAPLLEAFPMLPPMGNLTLVVAALSYAGQLNLTVVGDADSCPDLVEFIEGMRQTLDDLAPSLLAQPVIDRSGGQPPVGRVLRVPLFGGGR